MAAPPDVEPLMESLRQLGVHPGMVAQAADILSARAGDMGEWIELAVALRERGELHAALETYDTAMRRFPGSHVLWGYRGFLLLCWERYYEALENFAEALRIKPDYMHALANMASAYECLHEFARAAELFRAAVRLAPGHARAWNSLGLCLAWLDDIEGALESYRMALEADPNHKDPPFNLAALLCSRRRYREALPYAERLLAADPADGEAALLQEEILREPAEPRSLRPRDIYKEKRIVRLARREGSNPRFPRPEDIELAVYTVSRRR